MWKTIEEEFVMSGDKKAEFLEALKEFSASEHREAMKKRLEVLENLETGVRATVIELKILSNYASVKNLVKAEDIYKRVFIKTGNCETLMALSPGELQEFLDKKEIVNVVLLRFEVAAAALLRMTATFKRCFDEYDSICKYVNTGIRIYNSMVLNDITQSSEDYSEYFKCIGDELKSVFSGLESVSGYLPVGMKEYFGFMMKSAQACTAAFGIVDDYAKRLSSASKALDDLNKTIGTKKMNVYTGTLLMRMKDDRTDRQLDALE